MMTVVVVVVVVVVLVVISLNSVKFVKVRVNSLRAD